MELMHKIFFLTHFISSSLSDSSCLHVNCGGKDINVKDDKGDSLYLGDGDVPGGTATSHYSTNDHWGFSSTGDFMDDFNAQNIRYIVSLPSSNMPELYTTARVSPISLTYFHNCMENGNYTVNLHFAEIQFTNDNTYGSLGKRIFDIYVQVTGQNNEFALLFHVELMQ